MKMKDLGRDDRPREKMMESGAQALSNAELLAVILRSGTREMNVVDLARNLLAEGGGTLTKLSRVPPEMLCWIKGVGPGKALSVLAALELGRRMMQENTASSGTMITSPVDIYHLMIPLMKGLEHEQCWAVWLGRGARVLGKEMLSEGDDGSTGLDASAVARKAVAAKARRVILVHNHPTGDPSPSPADLRLTAEIKKALQLFRIELTDHVIMADGAFFSYSRETVTAV